MKPRDDIDADVISLLGEPYEIRLAGLLQIQIFLLADIRDLLQALQPLGIITQPPCDCARTKMDGESEHWPSCRYA